jgi:AbrB family looped-hinge helix DNA binding protein
MLLSSVVLLVRLIEYVMSQPSTTKMSSKGQVVIPEAIRERLGLKPGAQFVVVAGKDTVVLKAITPPSMDEFDELIADARRQARRVGLKQSDIADAITESRKKQ